MGQPNYFKHETSLVDQGAIIGNHTKIWHWTHVSSGAEIGEHCSLGQNVYVGNKVKIGHHVKIQNNVSVYDDVILEDYVFCGPSMVFTNVFNPRSEVVRKSEYKKTIVKRGATLGANCTIVCGVTIGEYAFIGAGAVVTKNVAAFALITGVPGRQTGWMSRYGEKLSLPVEGSGEERCPHTQKLYKLEGKILYEL